MGETYCEIDDHYIGYVEFFEHWCRRWAKERGRRMNQKCCTTCPQVDVNEMSDERYCSAIVKNYCEESDERNIHAKKKEGE